MNTRIIVERLIADMHDTYFVDYFDENRMEWKNHSSYKTLKEAKENRDIFTAANMSVSPPARTLRVMLILDQDDSYEEDCEDYAPAPPIEVHHLHVTTSRALSPDDVEEAIRGIRKELDKWVDKYREDT